MAFVKATKKKSKARVALVASSGHGKTYTSLRIAKGLGSKIAVIDTERGSASKYAGDVAEFDVCELQTFEPKRYIAALKDAAAGGYDVVIIDSLSHAWTGVGGLLDQKDKAGGKSSFDAWRNLTPQHNDLIEAILAYPGHVIATMRAKTEYVLEEVNGKKVPRKIGLAPVQRDGMEYEFDVVGDIDADHALHITKSRCAALDGEVIRKPGEDVAAALLKWLDQGVDEQPRVEKTEAEKIADAKNAIVVEFKRLNVDKAKAADEMKKCNGGLPPRTVEQFESVLMVLRDLPTPDADAEEFAARQVARDVERQTRREIERDMKEMADADRNGDART